LTKVSIAPMSDAILPALKNETVDNFVLYRGPRWHTSLWTENG
jgi:hypothetical protein